MDYKSVVYNAARDGNLNRLKIYLHSNKGKEEVSMLVASKTSGATPLVIACRNGHFHVAQYLIEKCGADVEQPGSVVFDGETIEEAPPLWCAAAAGYLDIVKLLISHGAKVNSTTRTKSTPLRAACFDGHLNIVKYLVQHRADIEIANRHGHTCLMIACYKGHLEVVKYLLELNADVNRRSVKGNTALHDCAESGSLDILRLLLDHGAVMTRDSYGMTPILAAAVTGHYYIVSFLIHHPDVSREEQIDALELCGATFVDKKRDMVKAIYLWKKAMLIRYLPGEKRINKPTPVIRKAYDYVEEVKDADELDNLIANLDSMRMHALIIRERILGLSHPDTSYFVRYRGAVYADSGRFDRCIDLWNYALDMQQSNRQNVHPMTQSSLFSFTELFSFMMAEEGKQTLRGIVPPADIREVLRVFNKAVEEVKFANRKLDEAKGGDEKNPSYLTRVMMICLHLSCLLLRLMEDAPKADHQQVRKAIYDFVTLDIKAKKGRRLLHLACCLDATLQWTYPACQFPSSKLAKVILEFGANPNCKDDEGNTPLHLTAMASPCPPKVPQVLLEHGAHIDTVNNNGDTFAALLKGQKVNEVVDMMKYTRLTCAAARVIQQFKIPYKGVVPVNLESFIACH
ncbi:protein fem-1 homolog CG6966 isoform X1 [Coccinella septempunctata]|uniref:protein fem-1 homolog CG6966 isoform X1 n=1 Tax=Coccinella septempunctata TaxID=41139 RepID=UPI001D082C18|nr:protein fem-1 homolog CG6966 isoform X1 [Coccinella septempunctata]